MLERWENIQRERGNTAGAEMARTLREQFGDVPTEPVGEEISLPTERSPIERLDTLQLEHAIDLQSAPESVGEILRNARLYANKSLRELAEEVGKSYTFLSDLEHNRRIPSEELIQRLSIALNIDSDQAMSLSGRLSMRVVEYLKDNPIAYRLVREIAERDLDEEKIQVLLQEVEQISREE